MNQSVLVALNSKKRSEILDALYDIGGSRNEDIPTAIKIDLIKLLSHSDADIREQAVNVSGIHLHLIEAYLKILGMVSGDETDQSVLITACDALGSMFVTKNIGDRLTISKALGNIVLKNELDPELRGTAYLNLCRINNQISIQDYATASRDLEELDWNYEWVKAF